MAHFGALSREKAAKLFRANSLQASETLALSRSLSRGNFRARKTAADKKRKKKKKKSHVSDSGFYR